MYTLFSKFSGFKCPELRSRNTRVRDSRGDVLQGIAAFRLRPIPGATSDKVGSDSPERCLPGKSQAIRLPADS